MKKCLNKCIFCFIDQLPKNLRSSLYIKDDDYLESFKYGNFITLTNLNKKDIENIIKYCLSPLYISFHSADENVRNILFGNKKSVKAIDILKIFELNNINIHIQIVLCPQINDGEDLLNTLCFLNNNFKNILSIGIVPIGITDYNKNPLLFPFNEDTSKELIKIINNFDKKENHKKNIFLSDEFYIIACLDFPEKKYYGSFDQIENGIGLCRNFIFDVECYLKKISKNTVCDMVPDNKNILILTSEYFYQTMDSLAVKIMDLNQSKTFNLNLNLKVDYIKNNFFGGNVKVAGLLTYYDFLCWFNFQNNAVNEVFGEYDKIIIPDIIFNDDSLTLDNKTKNDFFNLFKNVKFVKPDGKSFLKEIFDL